MTDVNTVLVLFSLPFFFLDWLIDNIIIGVCQGKSDKKVVWEEKALKYYAFFVCRCTFTVVVRGVCPY